MHLAIESSKREPDLSFTPCLRVIGSVEGACTKLVKVSYVMNLSVCKTENWFAKGRFGVRYSSKFYERLPPNWAVNFAFLSRQCSVKRVARCLTHKYKGAAKSTGHAVCTRI